MPHVSIEKRVDQLQMTPLLHQGSTFKGYQRSGFNQYPVTVEIHVVDWKHSLICGYLHISDLTEELPLLTTYFEGEIVGDKYSFYTDKWDANCKVDYTHWSKFEGFRQFQHKFLTKVEKIDVSKSDFLFMRWKECFLIPDHNVKNVKGASFAGFYYISLNKKTGEVHGYYYHHSSVPNQQLILEYVPHRSFAEFQFR